MTADVLEAISDLWPSWKPSRGLVGIWSLALSGFPTHEVLRAVLVHAQRSIYPPHLADLLAILTPERKTGLEAWGDVERYREWVLGGCSPASRVELEPEIRYAAESVMGPRWQYAEDWARERAANRARFVELFDRQQARRVTEGQHARADALLAARPPARELTRGRPG